MPKFTLEVEKTDNGLWLITSPEMIGLLVARHDLDSALGAVVHNARAILAAHAELDHTPETNPQMAVYSAILV